MYAEGLRGDFYYLRFFSKILLIDGDHFEISFCNLSSSVRMSKTPAKAIHALGRKKAAMMMNSPIHADN